MSNFLASFLQNLSTAQEIDKSLTPHIEKLQQVAANTYPAAIDDALSSYDSGKISAKELKQIIGTHGYAVEGGLNTRNGIRIYPLGGGDVTYTGQ